MKERQSGILLHVSSLPSSHGIGDLGPQAYAFVDFLQDTSQKLWQVLPLNPTNGITSHSPYSSTSAFAGNMLLISPQLLHDEGLIDLKKIHQPHFPENLVDYDMVWEYKKQLLATAFESFSRKKAKPAAYLKFEGENKFWLDDYALFTVIKKHFPDGVWTSWPKELKNREPKALDHFQKEFKAEIDQVKFVQYLFYEQWFKLKSYAHSKGIELIGDIPIYVNFDSADVWRNRAIFKLDPTGNPVATAGVPPDYFSQTGQRWGNPVYDWEKLQQSDYAWWIKRFEFNLKLFDQIRIDHFRGFVNYWEIPAEEQTAVKGEWRDVPTNDFFDTLRKKFKVLPFIAEDLGIITDQVREVIKNLGLPGMKILLFAFNAEKKDNLYLPHNYETECVVYTGTHDNNTVLGWFQNEATDGEKQHFFEYIKREVPESQVAGEFVKLAMNSKARVALIPLQDILGLGQEARMNKPSTLVHNWQWRFTPKAISQELTDQLRTMTAAADRSQVQKIHLARTA